MTRMILQSRKSSRKREQFVLDYSILHVNRKLVSSETENPRAIWRNEACARNYVQGWRRRCRPKTGFVFSSVPIKLKQHACMDDHRRTYIFYKQPRRKPKRKSAPHEHRCTNIQAMSLLETPKKKKKKRNCPKQTNALNPRYNPGFCFTTHMSTKESALRCCLTEIFHG